MSSSEQQLSTEDVTSAMDGDSIRETATVYAEKLRPQIRKLRPQVLKHSRSGTMAAATGALSVLRALRTFRRGRWGRGLLQLTFGLLWVGVALTQRRGVRDASVGESDVVSTSSSDLGAVETESEEYGDEDSEDVGDAIDTGVPVDEATDDEREETEGDGGESATGSGSGDDAGRAEN